MVVAVDMIILVVGLVVSQPQPRRIDVSFTTHYWECHSARNDTEIVFLVLSTIYAAAMLLFATFLAYKTRAAGQRYSHYSETKQMGLSVYNILFSALVGFAVLVNPMADFYTKYYITVITVLWATTFSLLALFLPKVHAFIKQQHKEKAGIFAIYHHFLKSIRKHHHKKDHESSMHHHYSHSQHQQSISQNSTAYGHHSSSFHTTGAGRGELISLNQMMQHHVPLDSNMVGGGSPSTAAGSATAATASNYVEVHEGEMPVRRVIRYFPFLSHWEMQHIMVFPCLGYFSFFSERTKEGAVMSYREATIYSAQLEEYVLKIHGQGIHDMYIQLPDLDALKIWETAFNNRGKKQLQQHPQQQTKNIDSSSFLHLDSDDENDPEDEAKHVISSSSFLAPPESIHQQNPHHQPQYHSSQRSLLARRQSERSSVTSETVAVNDHHPPV
ncbi:hypothetical protein BDA99DRAFT_14361 [Phascolomyces articulosus]|uniref:G-protein coupled receptors family 3 profile domain-containing protein n=1 Tax=Phascolomyces articulosus TaxID=60185 RepID=A0AAD5KCN2_9FUNG|nr:hypothetical protein BDA99DRAFT_14361 [Phascolomyces articulosus]